MFSVRQKREIADAVQKILRATNHPELPQGEIAFRLHVAGAESWSWADIHNNGGVATPGVNPWNEMPTDDARISRPRVRRKAKRRTCGCRLSGLDSCCRYDWEFRRQHTKTTGCCVCHRYVARGKPYMKCFRCGTSPR